MLFLIKFEVMSKEIRCLIFLNPMHPTPNMPEIANQKLLSSPFSDLSHSILSPNAESDLQTPNIRHDPIITRGSEIVGQEKGSGCIELHQLLARTPLWPVFV